LGERFSDFGKNERGKRHFFCRVTVAHAKMSENDEAEKSRQYVEQVKVEQEQLQTQKVDFEKHVDEYKDALQKQRDFIDSITEDNCAERTEKLTDYLAEMFFKNKFAYQNVYACVLGTVLAYQCKAFMQRVCSKLIDFPVDEQNQIRQAEKESLRAQKKSLSSENFQVDEHHVDDIVVNFVQALERSDGCPLRVLRYKKMLFPNCREHFEMFLPRPVHQWLKLSAVEAKAELHQKKEAFEQKDFEQYSAYLNSLAAGELPWNFVAESELHHPRAMLFYSRLLDVDAENEFAKLRRVDSSTAEWLREEAQKRLDTLETLPEDMRSSLQKQMQHLRSLISGNLPFGFHQTE